LKRLERKKREKVVLRQQMNVPETEKGTPRRKRLTERGGRYILQDGIRSLRWGGGGVGLGNWNRSFWQIRKKENGCARCPGIEKTEKGGKVTNWLDGTVTDLKNKLLGLYYCDPLGQGLNLIVNGGMGGG